MIIYTRNDARLHPFVAQLFEDTYSTPNEVLDLAMAIDKAIDAEYECGTSVVETSLEVPVKFEELNYLAMAAFAIVTRGSDDGSEVYTEEAMHHGWSYAVIHGQEFQTPEEVQQRLKWVALPFWLQSEELCPADEESEYTIAAVEYHRWRENLNWSEIAMTP